MSCTTLLVGKNASWNGSTMIARNDDSGAGKYTPKKFTVVEPEDQPRVYTSVLSHVKIALPDDPQRYTAMPNALKGEGIWAACGVNASDVAMTATETITSNPRVLGADPLVEYRKNEESDILTFGRDSVGERIKNAEKELVREEENKESVKDAQDKECVNEENGEHPGGIGEEDLVVITLPYIHSAREGVLRLGALLEQYGTYEENGIAFSDKDEIWWFESVGGHHWIAKRVDDDSAVVMPNQLGIDAFDLTDAFGKQENNLCSTDLREFIAEHHLDVSPHSNGGRNGVDESAGKGVINPRLLFGSHDDADHVYNTPRAWYMLRYLDGNTSRYDGPSAEFRPEDDDLPWSIRPSIKVTPEDVKYLLSSHFQGTIYDPYKSYGDKSCAGAYRSIGVNRTDFLGFVEIRPDLPEGTRAVEWIAFGSNVFNVMAPFYTHISRTPAYLSNTTGVVSTENFYWASRLIAALSDASFGKCQNVIELYSEAVMSKSHSLLNKWDAVLKTAATNDYISLCEKANEEIAAMLKKETDKALGRALFFRSNEMKNGYARSDH